MSLRERFEAQVGTTPGLGPDGECHEWTGHCHQQGYGRLRVGGRRGRMMLAHRVAWFLRTGSWPAACVLHSCDNPPCVRFDHLFLGTQVDNIADMNAKGRQRSHRGERNGAAKLTAEQVRVIRGASDTCVQLAARYGVSAVRISQTRRDKGWRHVAGFRAALTAGDGDGS